MTNPVPLAVLALIGDPVGKDPQHWFEYDLSVSELEEAVSVINAAMRSSRKI